MTASSKSCKTSLNKAFHNITRTKQYMKSEIDQSKSVLADYKQIS